MCVRCGRYIYSFQFRLVPFDISLNCTTRPRSHVYCTILYRGTVGLDNKDLNVSIPLSRTPKIVETNVFWYLSQIVGKKYEVPAVDLYKRRFPYYNLVKDELRGTVLFKIDETQSHEELNSYFNPHMMASRYDEAEFYRKRGKKQEKVLHNVMALLLAAKRPLTLDDIARQYYGGNTSGVQTILESAASNFEIYEDGINWYARATCNIGICQVHCSRSQRCIGMPPQCTGLHICKFYLLSDSCKFGQQCHFGHDLTTKHNAVIIKENFLDGVSVQDIRFLLKQSNNRQKSTIPKLCKFYNHESNCRYLAKGQSCPYIHICKYYMLNNCQFGKKCKRSHNIMEKETLQILIKHGIDTRRTPKEILTDLRVAINPESGSEASSVCSIPFSQGIGGSAHTVVYERQPFKQDSFDRTPVSRNSGSHQVSEGWQNCSLDGDVTAPICFYYLKGRCAYGKSCHNLHFDKPYQWVFREDDSHDWALVDPKQNMEIEMTYSDVSNKDHILEFGQRKVWVFFKKMRAKNELGDECYDVCRLSTVSYIERSNQPLATNWVWFFKDHMDIWMEYGASADGYKANIKSSDLEQAYINNPKGQMKFVTQGHEYVLNFEKMEQSNQKFKTQREVRRRPMFVSYADVEEKKKQAQQPRRVPGTPSKKGQKTVAAPTTIVPKCWNTAADEDLLDHYDLVQITKQNSDTRNEFKEIERLFGDTMVSTATITSIERIQNGDLWTNYVNKKAKMEKKNKDMVNEKRLFHGTRRQYIEAICRQGFDFRLSGQTAGTRFGKGSYFADTAQYSHCYTSQGDHALFVVKVLVGDYTDGDPTYVRPPQKNRRDPLSELYDSCVDDVLSPKIFVIFDNNGQVYPEYLIRYSMRYDL